jgi:hypothetical protein
MDVVGIGIVGTFFSLLATSVFGLQAQQPPSTSRATTCPTSGKAAVVTLGWNQTSQCLDVERCDSQQFGDGACGKLCLASVSQAAPMMPASNVIG